MKTVLLTAAALAFSTSAMAQQMPPSSATPPTATSPSTPPTTSDPSGATAPAADPSAMMAAPSAGSNPNSADMSSGAGMGNDMTANSSSTMKKGKKKRSSSSTPQ